MPRQPILIRKLTDDLFHSEHTIYSRRNFIRRSSQLMLGSVALFNTQCRSERQPKIAIIGAGMAGLTAAYYLERAGLSSTIYESLNRVGGRVISKLSLVANGITTEMGGEFIDSTHTDMLTFCREFNLPLLDMKTPAEKKLVGIDYFFNGHRISEQQIIAEFQHYAARMKQDTDSLPPSMNPKHPKVIELDNMSIDEYLHGIGMSGWLFDVLSTSFTSELGLLSGNQSSLNLLASLNTDTSKGFEIYGDSDERYKVVGGNERVPTEIQKRLHQPINMGYHLERISQNGTGYLLSFGNGQEVKADIVVLTVPFSVLREVEMAIELPARKRRCIQELGYGMQSKLFIGVEQRVWREKGYSGYVLSDMIHNGWDSSQMQHGNQGSGSYSLFLGADKGKNLSTDQCDSYLTQCDTVFPGIKQAANGRKDSYNWNKNPLARGAYACYKVGQVSGIGQAEAQTIGNLFFAGEHCSQEFQGYMNGAAETGRKAVEAICKKLGLTPATTNVSSL